jgi:hypothetical protein
LPNEAAAALQSEAKISVVTGRGFVTALLAALAVPGVAHACGAAYPGGPVYCTMADAPSAAATPRPRPRPLHLSLSWAFTSTTILFGDGKRADLHRHTVFAGTEVPIGQGASIRFGAGGIVAGQIFPHHERAEFGPGVSGYFGVAKSIVDEKTYVPFLQIGGTLSGSRVVTRGPAPNEGPSFTAFDLRAALTAGKTFGPVAMYATARAFGGPIFYRYRNEAVTGTDLYKYQVGGGVSLALPSHVVDAFVEGMALGERGIAAGLGTVF